MKRMFIFSALFLSFSSFAAGLPPACAPAAAANNPNFCSTFPPATECYCKQDGYPNVICKDIKTIYSSMIGVWGNVKTACQHQKDTDPLTCETDWNCYWNGGVDSQGSPCNATGKAC